MHKQGRGREGERESQAGSALTAQSQTWGSISWMIRPWPEPKSRVGHITNWVTQVPLNNIFLIPYSLPLHLDISMGGILKEQRKDIKGQETQTHPSTCRMYNSRTSLLWPGNGFWLHEYSCIQCLIFATTRTA